MAILIKESVTDKAGGSGKRAEKYAGRKVKWFMLQPASEKSNYLSVNDLLGAENVTIKIKR
jgi:hypothetical protein